MEKGSDMVAICFAIPLPSYDMEDFVAWGMTFFFFVKSAYYVEWDHRFSGATYVDQMDKEQCWWNCVAKNLEVGLSGKGKNICLKNSSWNFTLWS